MTSDEIIIRRDGSAGRITINRPKALNALTYPMVGLIAAALDAWRVDPAVELVLLDGAGDRALCAGGDVLSLYASRAEGSAFARRFWATSTGSTPRSAATRNRSSPSWTASSWAAASACRAMLLTAS